MKVITREMIDVLPHRSAPRIKNLNSPTGAFVSAFGRLSLSDLLGFHAKRALRYRASSSVHTIEFFMEPLIVSNYLNMDI